MNAVFKVNSWLYYHTHRSDKSQPGFPDLCAVHANRRRLVFAELKMPKGKLSPHQEGWLKALQVIHYENSNLPGSYLAPEVYLWYPKDEDEIVEIAGGKRPLW